MASTNANSANPHKTKTSPVPLWVKYGFTAFMFVLVPVYWTSYGPTNFLYFCDAALFLTLISVWTGNTLPASMAAVGILLPQFVWCIDFLAECMGFHLTGMTGYMFDTNHSLFLRGLSLFHGWLPFLLCFLVARLGYDRRALAAWSLLAFGLCLIAFLFLPPAGAILADPNLPRNIDYVFGLDDAHPQHLLPAGLYLAGWMAALFLVAYLPTHGVLRRFTPVS
jgi:hypothetical protein